jgi:soluble lytic murein transglycosylase-like protein
VLKFVAIAAGLGAGLYWLSTRQPGPSSSSPEAPAPSILEQLESQAAGSIGELVSSIVTWKIPAAGLQYAQAIATAEATYSLPQNLLARQLDIESNHFDPLVISGVRKSRAGAIGIAQFMPDTAAELKVDPTDAGASIDAAGRYMRKLYDRFNDWRLALAAYNWGQGNVARRDRAWPAETVAYVQKIATVANV